MSIPNINNIFTEKQGQYLAFIFYYTKINGMSPAQTDFQRYFNVSPPTVHQMILQLEKKNLITKQANTPRSIAIAIPEQQLPSLK
jgi:Mn-dependent DtxR family transcriptional regulator